MRKTLVLLLISALFLSMAIAQQKEKITLSLYGGPSSIVKPAFFSDYWKTGFNIGSSFDYELSRLLTVGVSFGYNNFTFNEDRFLEDFGVFRGFAIVGPSIRIYTISGILRVTVIKIEESLSPYVFGGLGFFRLSHGDNTRPNDISNARISFDQQSAACVLSGAGVEVPVDEISGLFFEGNYTIGFTKSENTSYLTGKIGVFLML